MHKIIYYTRMLLWYNRMYNRIVQEHYTLRSGRKTALVASLCVRVCVSFLLGCLRDRRVDDGVGGGLSESSKEKS